MSMRRKLIFLPAVYSKEIVDEINEYFDKGYEIENTFNADNGIYILLVLKGNKNYVYTHVTNSKLLDDNYNLIEENKKWVKTSSDEILIN